MGDEEFYQTLSSEKLSVLLFETRSALARVEEAIGPIREWKSRVQGALLILSISLTLITGLLGSGTAYLLVQWDGMKTSIVKLDVRQEEAVSNTAEIAKLASRVSNLETGSILHPTKGH